MGTLEIVILVVVLALLGAGAWYFMQIQKRKQLTGRFGPEYERAVHDIGDRKEAERELEQREQRVALLEIRPLDGDERARYAADWKRVQARFVDEPVPAVEEADRLIGEVMQRRGYPMSDFDRRSADLSVDHPDVVQHYRAGHELAEHSRDGRADTEDMRQAMVHYRALFIELLEEAPRPDPTKSRS
ncbi:MAG TPA: hypothetical protein VK939_03325 [Longimicrobiales bacterium]|nr:hypothetical protein [Longimicrobiales bacterium]